MASTRSSRWDRLALAALALGAVPAAALLAARGTPPRTDVLITWLVFLVLGLAWAAFARTSRDASERDLALAVVPATFLALVPFAPSLLVVAASLVLALADGVLRARPARAITVFAAASGLATGAASVLVRLLAPHPAPSPLDATLASVLAGLVWSAGSTLLVARWSDERARRRRARERRDLGLSPPVQAVITACAAGLLASSWAVHPLLIVVAAIPLTLLLLVAARLASDHRALELNRAELARVESRLARSEKLSALGQLASAVAHELNNPLASIIAAAELLAAGEERCDPTERRLRQRILGEARRASLIVSELLAFSRERRPRRGPCRVERIVGQVLEGRAEACAKHGIRLTADVQRDLPPLTADCHQLGQLLLNLVTNAEQALRGAGGGGEITVRARRVGDALDLIVSDDGPGIPRDAAARVFEPFFTTKPPGEGTGLGLAICAGIVEEHGGTIDLVSRPSRGTLVSVRIPWVAADGDAEAAATAETAPTEPTIPTERFGAGHRVLVADDEEGVREVLTEALARWGFEVVGASDGQQALAALGKQRFDLGLIDLQLPDIDGAALLRRAEETGCAPRGALFVSGELAADPTSTGGRPVLAKPFTLETLRAAIEGALADQRAAVPSAV